MTIFRYLDERNHLLRQVEVCDEHAGLIMKREQRRSRLSANQVPGALKTSRCNIGDYHA
jgi:hypothetical protein